MGIFKGVNSTLLVDTQIGHVITVDNFETTFCPAEAVAGAI